MDGDPAALAAFRDAVVPALRPGPRQARTCRHAQIDETIQRVLVIGVRRRRSAPQIETYAGRGTLRSWLRTIAVRTGRRMLGIEGRPSPPRTRSPAAGRGRDPEIELLRGRYRDQVKAAFAAAFAQLGERERNVLRQYHIDGLTIDQLATLLPGQPRDHRALGRRCAARGDHQDAQQLVEHYGVAASEVDSIIRLVRSQLDVSVREMAP